MAVKLSVGLQRKVGLADYGSVGASCHVEFEIDSNLLYNDLEEFHDHARGACVACQQAVNDQLAAQLAGHERIGTQPPPANGYSSAKSPNGNGNGDDHRRQAGRSDSRMATPSQVRALRAIASRRRIDLSEILGSRFGVAKPQDLSLRDASALIDELKQD